METYLDKLYIIFALHGETALIWGFCNPVISDRVKRNVVPRKLYKWIILAIHFSIIYLPHFHCACLINY